MFFLMICQSLRNPYLETIVLISKLITRLMKNTLRLILLFLIFIGISIVSNAQQEKVTAATVMVLEIRDEIGAPINRYTELALEHAQEIEADYVIVDMDTYGGAVNDADDIRTRFLEFEKPIWVYINKNAASAGALISIACDKIYMEKGSNIGAATVVNGTDGAKAPDKYQSYMRSMMRSTAESNGRDPKIAEAMVDENLEVEGISNEGQVITFTTSEAIEYGFCEGEVEDIKDILELNNVEDYIIEEYKPSSVEVIISFFLNPALSGILMLVILGGIYFELQSPGIGFPLFAAIIAAILYFIPYYLSGLAANWEIIVFIIGILLIAAEIFVIPGFGVAGISGIFLTFSALILVMLDNNVFDFTYVPMQNIVSSVTTALAAGAATILLIFFGASRISAGDSLIFKRVALQETLQKDDGYTSSFLDDGLIGQRGIAFSVLRPAGKIKIGEEIYDASTRGGFIEKGEIVEVISHQGTSLKVRRV